MVTVNIKVIQTPLSFMYLLSVVCYQKLGQHSTCLISHLCVVSVCSSDGWGNRLDVVENLETAAAGGISIKLYSPAVNDFGPHYAKLKPTNSSKNPWMTEFWEWRFNCSMDKNNMKHYPRFCSGESVLFSVVTFLFK